MTAIPKPPRRGPKPRRPIARGRRPRRVRARTSGFISFVGSAGKGKLRELADDLQSLLVRHEAAWLCWVCGSHRWEEMQAMHLFAKSEYRAGRYNLDNLRCGCYRCHKYYTERPTEWTHYLMARLGDAAYQRLRDACSVRQGPWDYGLVAIDLKQRLSTHPRIQAVHERFEQLLERGRKLGVWK